MNAQPRRRWRVEPRTETPVVSSARCRAAATRASASSGLCSRTLGQLQRLVPAPVHVRVAAEVVERAGEAVEVAELLPDLDRLLRVHRLLRTPQRDIRPIENVVGVRERVARARTLGLDRRPVAPLDSRARTLLVMKHRRIPAEQPGALRGGGVALYILERAQSLAQPAERL